MSMAVGISMRLLTSMWNWKILREREREREHWIYFAQYSVENLKQINIHCKRSEKEEHLICSCDIKTTTRMAFDLT